MRPALDQQLAPDRRRRAIDEDRQRHPHDADGRRHQLQPQEQLHQRLDVLHVLDLTLVEQRPRLTADGDLHLQLARRRLEVGDEGVRDALQLRIVEASRDRHAVVAKAAQDQIAVADQAAQAGANQQQRQQHHEGDADGGAGPGEQVGRSAHPRGGCGAHAVSAA